MDKKILEELMALDARLQEDRLYEIALSELDTQSFDPVAKAKAFEEAEGDAQKAKAFYIKHRVRRIRDQLVAEGVEAEVTAATEAKTAKYDNRQLKKQKAKDTGIGLIRGFTDFIVISVSSLVIFTLALFVWSLVGAGPSLSIITSLASTFLIVRWLFISNETESE